MLKTSIICLNNLGVVMLSTIIAVVFFKERLSKVNVLGLAMSVIALLLLMV
jgi:multidrug transporter EmrE-like cation transporter